MGQPAEENENSLPPSEPISNHEERIAALERKVRNLDQSLEAHLHPFEPEEWRGGSPNG